jgi:hypothetical protein
MRLSCTPMGRTCSSDILTMRSNLWAANQGNTSSFAVSCSTLCYVPCFVLSSVLFVTLVLFCSFLLLYFDLFPLSFSVLFCAWFFCCYFTLYTVLHCAVWACCPNLLFSVLFYSVDCSKLSSCSVLLSSFMCCSVYDSHPALFSACPHFILSKLLSELLSALLSCSLLLYSFPAQLRCTLRYRSVLYCALLYCTVL